MQIYIPTRDRVNAQFTWDNLGPVLQQNAALVCPPEEVSTHVERGRRAIARPPLKLAGVRQWLVDEAVNRGEGHLPIIMCDDDLAFFVRKDPSAHNLRPAGADVISIFQRLDAYVAGTPMPAGINTVTIQQVHAGLSPRQGNNWSYPATVEFNNRMNAVHAILPNALHHYGIRYDDVDMMEDYHVTLSLFERGEANVTIQDAAWDQCKGSGAPGGFSHYRTKETQAAAANKLAELHPHSVKTVTKNPSTGNGGFAGERLDVRVQWKQAYNRGLRGQGKMTPTFVR